MKDTLFLGPAPHDERCAQLGPDDDEYISRARRECNAFIKQLKRTYGKELPESVRLRIVAERHDFGTYYEVGVTYDTDDEKAAEVAFWFDANVPATWDAEARAELLGNEPHGIIGDSATHS